MQDRFGQLSWLRMLCRSHRRRPTTPIRRKPVLELIRLDDRLAPGSVWATAAAQAVALGGPLAWLGLGDSELSAVGDLASLPAVSAASDSPTDDGHSDGSSAAYFTRTSAGSTNADRQAVRQWGADSDNTPLTTPLHADLGEPAEESPSSISHGAASSLSQIGVPTGGSTSIEHSDPSGGIRSAGVPSSVRVPSPAPTDPAGPVAASPLRGGGGGRSSSTVTATPPAARTLISPSITGSSNAFAAPGGRLGGRLQALLHSGNSAAGTINLAGTANNEGQIGSLIGGQLTDGTSSVLGFNSSPSHRPASLLGQAMRAGSDQSLGLRSSKASSGPFGLVGTQSIGNMLTGHGPRDGGLLGGRDKIAAAIPANGRLPRPSLVEAVGVTPSLADGGRDPAAGLPGAVLTPIGSGGSSGGSTAPRPQSMTVTPGTFTLTFSLLEQWGDPGNVSSSLAEQGTVSFIGLNGGGYEDYGSNYVYAHVSFGATLDSLGYYVEWYGYADPAGMLYGTDFAQFNQQAFGYGDPSLAPYFVYDSSGGVPFTATDTDTPTDHNGNVTTQHNYNNSATGDEGVAVHEEKNDGSLQITVDDTTGAEFHNRDDGTDDAPAATADDPFSHDTFTDTADGTAGEVDHYEGTIASDGSFELSSFRVDITDDFDFSDWMHGSETTPENGGSETDTFTDTDNGHDHEHLHAEGTATDWTASLDDNAGDTFNAGDNGADNTSVNADGATDTNHETFYGGDNGADTDVFHLEGHGTATTFTATDVSDEIHDNYYFNDWDDGTAGEQSTPETDSDHYHETDNGTADERLTISTGTDSADTLTATYTDTAHDGFTDSDAEHDQWSRTGSLSGGLFVPGGGGGGTDTGHDDATDGDDGSEDLQIGVGASMPGWQSTNPDDPPPAWSITNVDATVNGTANVQAHDDDTDVAAVNQDSANEHVVDTSTGTDNFGASIEGTGDAATLTQNIHYTLNNQSEEDTTDNWDDPSQVNGAPAPDTGSEAVDITDTDTAHVDVQKVSTINAAGTTGPVVTTVHVGDAATIDETDDGGETIDDGSDSANGPVPGGYLPGPDPDTGNYISGINREVQQVHDTDHLTDGVGVLARSSSGIVEPGFV